MVKRFLALALIACATPAMAQEVEIKTQQLAPGVAVLFGSGGNIGVSYGPDGTVLIDDQFAPLSDKIKAAVAALGATPVKYLVNTHWHGDHSGGNENFANAGAIIFAHENVRIRMADPPVMFGRKVEASPAAALPVVTYADGIKLHLNSEEVRIIHVPPAHTDGDSLIYWNKSNVLHMGDTFFFKETFPFIDAASGGDVRGVIKAADAGLAIADDNTKIIPGHGPVATKADLLAYRTMIADIVGKVDAGIKAGKTLDQIKAMRPADGYGVKADGFITADGFVETVYGMLKG
jgi:cyclase